MGWVFFISCLFRFISIIPDTALSGIITIISLLYLSGNNGESKGLTQEEEREAKAGEEHWTYVRLSYN